MDVNNSKVIMSGADTKIFNNKRMEIWDNSNNLVGIVKNNYNY